MIGCLVSLSVFFFFNDTATTEIYTLSLHDALPISFGSFRHLPRAESQRRGPRDGPRRLPSFPKAGYGLRSGKNSCQRSYRDRKSTRLNSSHGYISYAVFCLKKKKNLHHAAGFLNRAT